MVTPGKHWFWSRPPLNCISVSLPATPSQQQLDEEGTGLPLLVLQSFKPNFLQPSVLLSFYSLPFYFLSTTFRSTVLSFYNLLFYFLSTTFRSTFFLQPSVLLSHNLTFFFLTFQLLLIFPPSSLFYFISISHSILS